MNLFLRSYMLNVLFFRLGPGVDGVFPPPMGLARAS